MGSRPSSPFLILTTARADHATRQAQRASLDPPRSRGKRRRSPSPPGHFQRTSDFSPKCTQSGQASVAEAGLSFRQRWRTPWRIAFSTSRGKVVVFGQQVPSSTLEHRGLRKGRSEASLCEYVAAGPGCVPRIKITSDFLVRLILFLVVSH